MSTEQTVNITDYADYNDPKFIKATNIKPKIWVKVPTVPYSLILILVRAGCRKIRQQKSEYLHILIPKIHYMQIATNNWVTILKAALKGAVSKIQATAWGEREAGRSLGTQNRHSHQPSLTYSFFILLLFEFHPISFLFSVKLNPFKRETSSRFINEVAVRLSICHPSTVLHWFYFHTHIIFQSFWISRHWQPSCSHLAWLPHDWYNTDTINPTFGSIFQTSLFALSVQIWSSWWNVSDNMRWWWCESLAPTAAPTFLLLLFFYWWFTVATVLCMPWCVNVL